MSRFRVSGSIPLAKNMPILLLALRVMIIPSGQLTIRRSWNGMARQTHPMYIHRIASVYPTKLPGAIPNAQRPCQRILRDKNSIRRSTEHTI